MKMSIVNAQMLVQKFWPEWQIESWIGDGAYGSVFQAVRQDYAGEYRSAIKIVEVQDADHSINSQGNVHIQEYVAEIQLMNSLKGRDNFVSIEDWKIVESHQDEQNWYIVIRMELLTTLMNNLLQKDSYNENEIIRVGRDICKALEICKEHNIVHGDIKPGNIFVSEDGQYKLGDFGVSKVIESITMDLSLRGTPLYMAPEFYTGTNKQGTNPFQVDICSLGLVLYQLSNNNKLPFMEKDFNTITGEEVRAAVSKRFRGEPLPKPENASSGLSNVILKATQCKPENRYHSAYEMRRDLESIGNHTDKHRGSHRTHLFIFPIVIVVLGIVVICESGFIDKLLYKTFSKETAIPDEVVVSPDPSAMTNVKIPDDNEVSVETENPSRNSENIKNGVILATTEEAAEKEIVMEDEMENSYDADSAKDGEVKETVIVYQENTTDSIDHELEEPTFSMVIEPENDIGNGIPVEEAITSILSDVVCTDTQKVRIRLDADINADVIGYLTNEMYVRILGITGDWIQIERLDMTGYVIRDYINVDVRYVKGNINQKALLYELNNENSNVLGKYDKGTSVILIDKGRIWSKVMADRQIGYMKSDLLTERRP